ncbi:MAG: hypothetical protein WC340_09995 [Kiritimatiellia bacterium]
MKTTRVTAILTMAAVIMGARSSFALSDPILVNTSPSQNRRWTAVFTNEVPLQWGWCCTNATSAQLEIVGMNSTFTTNFTVVTSNYLWQAFSTSTPSNEDVYDLTLTFYNSGSAVVGALTSRLAVVQGALGQTGVISTSEATPWPKINKNAVISYEAGWKKTTAAASESQLVIAKEDGMTRTNALVDTAGYFGWKIKRSDWGYGTFNLALTFPGTEGEWNGTLVRTPEGMIIQVR